MNKIGIYGVGDEEIIIALNKALNNLEGDFDDKSLFRCLEMMKLYPYTSNSKRPHEIWEDYIHKLGEFE